jgi:hypothetical protein
MSADSDESTAKSPETADQSPEAQAKKELAGLKRTMQVVTKTMNQIGDFLEENPDLNNMEKLKHIGGMIGIAALGFIFESEAQEEWFQRGAKTEQQIAREESPDENANESEEEAPETDEVITDRRTLINMAAINYYKLEEYQENGKKRFQAALDENGNPIPQPKFQLANYLKKRDIVPSAFITKGSDALLNRELGSYESFKEKVTSRLPHESTPQSDRVNHAAIILSCCAVGRYQIVPHFHFEKMGWPTEGEEGLKALYNFIKSEKRQINLAEKIVGGLLSQHDDPGLAAYAYYSGGKDIAEYKKNPNAPRFTQEQSAGHMSIDSYVKKARAKFAKFKAEGGFTDAQCTLFAIESIESGGSYAYNFYKQGGNLNEPERVTRPGGMEVLGKSFEGLEKVGPIKPLETETLKIKGRPGWRKNNVDDWDYEAFGNNDSDIKSGVYHVESVKEPKGYTRKGTNRIPKATRDKITEIAKYLKNNDQMPLFTGIEMTIDGHEILMVKEIHCWRASQSSSRYLTQPHSGTAFMVKT